MLAELPRVLLELLYRLSLALTMALGTGCQLTRPFQQTAVK